MTLQSMSMFAVSVGQKNLVQRNWMVLKRIGSVRAIPLGAVRCQCLWEKKIIQTHALYIYIEGSDLRSLSFVDSGQMNAGSVPCSPPVFHRFTSSLITYITCYRVRAIVTVPSGKAVQWHAKPAACSPQHQKQSLGPGAENHCVSK